MTQETIKKDAEEYYVNNIFCDGITEFEHDIAIRCYIAGAKDQQEKMYSAEKPKQELPYWFETQEWKQFSKLAENNSGGKPKQERMYSEEEVIRILDKREDYLGTEPSIFDYLTNEEWFQLFKIK